MKIIKEAAKTIKNASQNELALYKDVSNGFYILWNPEELIKITIDGINKKKWKFDIDFLTAMENQSTNYIKGLIQTAPAIDGACNGASEVIMSAAIDAYGPLMYDIAMSDNAIMSDRFAVSAPAKNIWKFYQKRSDVNRKAFDDQYNPKTPPKFDDCRIHPDNEELNYSYTLDNSPNTSNLEFNHNDAISEILDILERRDWHVSKEEFETTLIHAGRKVFRALYTIEK